MYNLSEGKADGRAGRSTSNLRDFKLLATPNRYLLSVASRCDPHKCRLS